VHLICRCVGMWRQLANEMSGMWRQLIDELSHVLANVVSPPVGVRWWRSLVSSGHHPPQPQQLSAYTISSSLTCPVLHASLRRLELVYLIKLIACGQPKPSPLGRRGVAIPCCRVCIRDIPPTIVCPVYDCLSSNKVLVEKWKHMNTNTQGVKRT